MRQKDHHKISNVNELETKNYQIVTRALPLY